MVTQLEIARRVGLDVSSCNKILNRVPGPVFRKETIASVFRVARELGYNFERRNKHYYRHRAEKFEQLLRKIMPTDNLSESMGQSLGINFDVACEIREALYPKQVKRGRPRRVAAAL